MHIKHNHFQLTNRRRMMRSSPLPRLLIFIVALSAAVFMCCRRIEPVIQEYAYNQAVHIASSALNEAVYEVLQNNQIEYSDIIQLLTDDTGHVAALQANTLKINQLRSDVVENVMSRLDNLSSAHIRIPLFTGVRPSILSKLSPKISVMVEPLGTAYASMGNEFYDAGINQTMHRITMNVRANVTILLPNSNVTAGINTDVSIAETIIVGSVPESYSAS